MEPIWVPFLWTVAVTCLSFMSGEALGRAGMPLGYALFFGFLFSVILASARLLLAGVWSIP